MTLIHTPEQVVIPLYAALIDNDLAEVMIDRIDMPITMAGWLKTEDGYLENKYALPFPRYLGVDPTDPIIAIALFDDLWRGEVLRIMPLIARKRLYQGDQFIVAARGIRIYGFDLIP